MKNAVNARAVRRAVSGGRARVAGGSGSGSVAPGPPSRRARHARRNSSTARNVSSPASRPTTRPSVAASQRTSWRSCASWGRATGGGSGTVAATWEVVMAVIVSHDRGDHRTAQGVPRLAPVRALELLLHRCRLPTPPNDYLVSTTVPPRFGRTL